MPDTPTAAPGTAAGARHLSAGGGRSLAHLGASITFKYEPGDNDAGLLLFECRMPAGHGVPPHTERNDEAFYVLEGVLEIEAGGERFRLGPGDFLSIRPGTPHALHNPGPGWLRALMLAAPGSGHVRFFTRLGEPIEDPFDPPEPQGPPDVARLVEIGLECGLDFRPAAG